MCTTRGRTGRRYGIFVVRKGHVTSSIRHFPFVLLVVMHQTLPQPTAARRVGMTNVTDLRRQWSSSQLHEATTALAVNVLSWMRCCRSQPCNIVLTTTVPPAGPEQATSVASRQRLRAHNKPETTPGTQKQPFGFNCSATNRGAPQRHEHLHQYYSIGIVFIEVIGLAVLNAVPERSASQRRNLVYLQLPVARAFLCLG